MIEATQCGNTVPPLTTTTVTGGPAAMANTHSIGRPRKFGSRQAFVDWFWSRVDKSIPSGCWEWVSKRDPKGYGDVSSRWVSERKAHRVAFLLTFGPVPPGLVVMHKCDNPPCVNPSHLCVGAATENVRDAIAKGRRKRIPSQRLSASDARTIRERYWIGGETGVELAKEFGISTRHLSGIVRGESFPGAGGPMFPQGVGRADPSRLKATKKRLLDGQ